MHRTTRQPVTEQFIQSSNSRGQSVSGGRFTLPLADFHKLPRIDGNQTHL